MQRGVEGNQSIELILSHDLIVDGSKLFEMPEIKLQRVLRCINPAILVSTMSYSELVNSLVKCVVDHIKQFHIEA